GLDPVAVELIEQDGRVVLVRAVVEREEDHPARGGARHDLPVGEVEGLELGRRRVDRLRDRVSLLGVEPRRRREVDLGGGRRGRVEAPCGRDELRSHPAEGERRSTEKAFLGAIHESGNGRHWRENTYITLRAEIFVGPRGTLVSA